MVAARGPAETGANVPRAREEGPKVDRESEEFGIRMGRLSVVHALFTRSHWPHEHVRHPPFEVPGSVGHGPRH